MTIDCPSKPKDYTHCCRILKWRACVMCLIYQGNDSLSQLRRGWQDCQSFRYCSWYRMQALKYVHSHPQVGDIPRSQITMNQWICKNCHVCLYLSVILRIHCEVIPLKKISWYVRETCSKDYITEKKFGVVRIKIKNKAYYSIFHSWDDIFLPWNISSGQHTHYCWIKYFPEWI